MFINRLIPLQALMNAINHSKHAAMSLYKLSLVSMGCIAICGAIANAWAQNKPGAGDLLNNIAPTLKNSSELNHRKSDKLLIQKNNSQLLEQAPADITVTFSFEVQGLVMEGNTVFSTQELLALLPQTFPGVFTLSQLEAKLVLLTEHYRQAGYPLVQVRIPEQVLQNGMVSVRITEPIWGQVLLNNQSQIKDAVLLKTASGIAPGTLVKQADLERTLLLLADLPGAQISGEMQPGALADTTDLLIRALSVQPVSGAATMDNLGSKYTGRNRATATLIVSNPFLSGDAFTFNLMSSGALLNYQRLGYELPIGGPGMQLGASSAQMNYRLGEGAESLQAHGLLGQQTVWLDYAWLRDTRHLFKTKLQFDYMDPADHQDASNLKTDRYLRILTVSTNHESSDFFIAGGLNQWNMELAHGQMDFTNQAAAANDEVTARTAGRFTKLNLRGYRNQAINSNLSFSISLDSQWAQKNLDATQKFSLGGLRSVRAYESGVISADSGIFSSMELRVLLPQPGDKWNIQGQWYASIFWDKAVAQVNQNPWNQKSNFAYLRGTGLALYWQGPNEWRASASLGKSLGSVSSLLTSADAVHQAAWIELAKGWR